jgi:flagellar basal-body rod protein FlgC
VDPLVHSLAVSASGLTAERLRLAVISNNIANLDTDVTPSGQPFRRQAVVLAERGGGLLPVSAGPAAVGAVGDGVEVVAVVEDPAPPGRVYDPANPLADAQGYVARDSSSPVLELVDLLDAARHYEANVTAMQTAKTMVESAIRIGSGG